MMETNEKKLTKKEMARNERIANRIRDFVIKNNLGGDLRIYFNGKAYAIDHEGNVQVIEDVWGSNFFKYANDKMVSMSFEGSFYDVMNYSYVYTRLSKLEEQFSKMLNRFGVYYKLGYDWSLSIYE